MSGMLNSVADRLKTRPVEIMTKVENNLSEIHDLKQNLDKLKDQLMSGEAERMLYGAKDIKGLKVITITNGPVTAADIRKMGDQLKDRFPNIVAVLAATAEDKATMLAVCGKNAVARGITRGRPHQEHHEDLRRLRRRQARFRNGRLQGISSSSTTPWRRSTISSMQTPRTD